MIRVIRLLGAALGASWSGLSFVAGSSGIFGQGAYAGALIAAWLVAWVVVGLRGPPVPHRRPGGWLVRGVQDLSTAEFVTAIVGLARRAS